MYEEIGLRNIQAIRVNGAKLVHKLRAKEETKHIAFKIEHRLNQLDELWKAANQIVNQ